MATPPLDISRLNESQQAALQTYTSVTDQEPLAAIPLLQRCEWNVQIAIARFFDGEPSTDVLAEARAALPSTSARHTSNIQYESLLSAARPTSPRRPPTDTVERIDTSTNGDGNYPPPFLLSALFVPLNLIYRLFSTILSPFSFLLPSFIPRLLARFTAQRSQPARRSLPPADNARRFIRELGEEYGEHNLPFVESGFNLTLDNAKRDLKFLMVVLISPSHDDNHSWIRDTLLSAQVRDFLSSQKDDVVLWGGNVQDAEAYQVSESLQCTKFPFVALVCHSSDTGSTGMTTVMRAVGPMPATELVAKLGTAVTAHRAQLRAARSQRAEQQASRTLRQEQDSAYERSLAQDRERARRRKEEEEAQARAEKEALALAEAAEKKMRDEQQWRRWRAQSLPDEPSASVKDAIRVSIRMPSGERIIRRFDMDADLEELYAFVECHEVARNTDQALVDEPVGYEHQYRFYLVSPMPRTVYDLEKGGSIGERIGRGGNLIVEPINEDDDDETDGES
jgi:FAS-associated factor 2